MPGRWSWKALLTDPPPVCAFELSERGMASALLSRPPSISFAPWQEEVISVSPVRDNILRPDVLLARAREGGPAPEGRKRRRAALILPDYSVRVTVLDFDDFPSDAREQASLVRFRLKRSVPFDVESAALSYYAQARSAGRRQVDVVAAVAPLEIVARYEAPFRQAGFHVGWVTTSALACLELAPPTGVQVLAKRTGRVLSLAVTDNGALRLIRAIELAEGGGEEILDHLAQTMAYVEDQLSAGAERLLLCGLGEDAGSARARLEAELGIHTAPLASRLGTPDEHTAGLLGYAESVCLREA